MPILRIVSSQSAENLLFAYRRSAGMTQLELAKLLGISLSYMSLLEAGKRPPGPKLARTIETLLGIPKSRLRPDLWS